MGLSRALLTFSFWLIKTRHKCASVINWLTLSYFGGLKEENDAYICIQMQHIKEAKYL